MEHNNSQNMQEDIAFIKSMISKTQKVIDPGAYFFILWGVIIILGDTIIPFIDIDMSKLYWLIAAPVGITLTVIINIYLYKTQAYKHFTSLSQQIGLLWATFGCGALLLLALTSLFPDRISLLHFGLLIYALMAMTYFAIGIIYLREYYMAGILIFSTALIAYFHPEIWLIALAGLVAGGSNIVLGTLALIRLKQG